MNEAVSERAQQRLWQINATRLFRLRSHLKRSDLGHLRLQGEPHHPLHLDLRCWSTEAPPAAAETVCVVQKHWNNAAVCQADAVGVEGGRPTSALYILTRPWLTLDQEGTALMFHSWLECSANGPVFICTQRDRAAVQAPHFFNLLHHKV